MTRLRSPRMRLENFIVTHREEEVPKEDHMVEETIFLEQEEEAEEEK
jgi:hypothetical protein